MSRPVDRTELKARPADRRRPNLFTVPPGRPFLDALAAAVLEGNLPAVGGIPPDPLALPDITILLPTRRATRALQEAFLRASGGRAMLLPRMRPIAEGDEDLSLLAEAAAAPGFGAADAAEIPPPISELQRRLALTSLIMRWIEARRSAADAEEIAPAAGAEADTPAKAAQLAKELGRLMDMVETEGASFDRLAGLVPETFSEHWQTTLRFLDIVTGLWPDYLAAEGLISPADRRNRVIEADARRLAELPPAGPVIVAGVTGSIPATVALMRAVADLPNGAIILPALDLGLDEESWQTIIPDHPEHPQFGLKKLLEGLGLARADVALLSGTGLDPAEAARRTLVSEIMRPAATTARWHDYTGTSDPKEIARALDGVALLEAPGAQDEAEAVALILRQALETPGRTAALVSPDRLLARRVAVRLESWGIRVDDSAGRPFAKTVPGAFLDLVLEAIAKDFAPAELMALLKHPLCRLGLTPREIGFASRALEIAAFRQPYLGRGLDGVDAALARVDIDLGAEAGPRAPRAARRLRAEDRENARDLLARLRAAYAPLLALFERGEPQTLRTFAAAHAETAVALARSGGEDGGEDPSSELWRGEAGEVANRFFQNLADETLPEIAVSRHDYPDLYRSLLAGENVRPRVPVHPRLAIWGPMEARLQQPDVVILGSLNDGTWPEAADPGPWLNRPMRRGLGLPSPEEKIGYSAHDFATLLGANQVYLTRAAKIDGVPTVPSRWLLRLQALLGGLGAADALKSREPWLGWARHRDYIDPARAARIERPMPCPALALRPRKLSVTRVETWIKNPYAIFAREILGLEPLPGLGAPPPASLRGTMIHEALSRFARAYPTHLPPDPAQELVRHARDVLALHAAHPRVAAFWMPRFARFAEWFAATEPARRQGVAEVIAETRGSLSFASTGGPFTLTARADRVDVGDTGLVITDYKSGAVPKGKQVIDGSSPQLPLEAAIALGLEPEAGFEHVPGGSPVAALRYIRASGAEPPGEEHVVKCGDVRALASDSLAGLKRLVARFDLETTPYAPVRRARFAYDYDDYAHLARVAEWSAERPDDGEG